MWFLLLAVLGKARGKRGLQHRAAQQEVWGDALRGTSAWAEPSGTGMLTRRRGALTS